MTPILLHGLQSAGSPSPALEAGTICVESAGLRALCSVAPAWMAEPDRASDANEERTVAAALRHDAILRAALTPQGVVPVRFGTLFSSENALRAALGAEAEIHMARIRRVAGACELGLVVADIPENVPPDAHVSSILQASPSGRDFLRAKRAFRDRRRDRETLRSAWLAGFVRDLTGHVRACCRREPRDGRLLDLALLVATADLEMIEAFVVSHSRAASGMGLGLSLGRPMPPYSFAEPVQPIAQIEVSSQSSGTNQGAYLETPAHG
jgi:hypothetical protein